MVDQVHEIELKLRVPATWAAAVDAAVAGRQRVARTRLQAFYCDTPANHLAQAGLAWRVRREGARWVQTLKATAPDGGDGMRREEHNVVIAGRARPEAEPALHAGTPAGALLTDVLRDAGEEPGERFRTDVWRRERQIRASGGRVAVAFDSGTVVAGDASRPVCELEIELLAGDPRAVIRTARTWVRRYGLWLDSINKSQLGHMLASGEVLAPVRRGLTPALDAGMSRDAAAREIVRACLVQVIANTSALAGDLGSDEHVHQARVGIRRLRTALRELGSWTTDLDATWDVRLHDTFHQLGDVRDRDVLLAEWMPVLREAGGPAVEPPPLAGEDPGNVLRAPAFTLLLLDLLEFVHTPPEATGDELLPAVTGLLRRARKRALRHAATFDGLSDEEQHLLRRRLKRLRDLAELTASLFPPKRVRRFLDGLAPALRALGELNDLTVAMAVFRSLAEHDEQAWFAVGWLTARREVAVRTCRRELRAALDAEPHWR